MKTNLVRTLCLILALIMAISLIGCTPKPGPDSSDVSSSTDSTDTDDSDTNTEEEPDDDEGYDDEWIDETPEDNDDTGIDYIDELLVQNSGAPAQKGFLGLNGVYHCYTFMEMTDGRTYTEKQANYEIDKVKNLKVHMVRSYYGTKYAYDATTDSFNWESDDMKAIYRWMKNLQEGDVEIALNAGWGLTQFLPKNKDGRGVWDFFHGVFVKDDPEQSAKNYASWMVESLKQFKAHGCNNVTSLLLFTEPGGFHGTRWGASEPYDGRWDGMSVTEIEDPNWPVYLNLTIKLDKALKDAGIRKDYLMVGPNEAHTYESDIDGGTYYLPMFYNALTEANDYLDVFSHHNYVTIPDMTSDVVAENLQIYWRERAELTKELTGKPFWMDETNIRDNSNRGDVGGVRMENPWEAMQIATMVAEAGEIGVQNILLWSLASQNWNNHSTNDDAFLNGVQRTGLLPSPYLSFKPHVSYYGIKLLTEFFGHGDVYVIEDGVIHAMAEQDEDGEWTVVLVNADFEETTFRLDFEKAIGKRVFYRYLYNTATQTTSTSAPDIEADLGIRTNDGHFTDTLPGASFAVYTTKAPK